MGTTGIHFCKTHGGTPCVESTQIQSVRIRTGKCQRGKVGDMLSKSQRTSTVGTKGTDSIEFNGCLSQTCINQLRRWELTSQSVRIYDLPFV